MRIVRTDEPDYGDLNPEITAYRNKRCLIL